MKRNYSFYVYIMSNFERTCYYIGFCNNIVRRTIEHTHGIGCKFSRKYKTNDLLYYELYKYVNSAMSREREIKKWRREKKLALIQAKNPELKSLNQQLFDDYGIARSDIIKIVLELKEKYKCDKTY
ncbi:MAG: GIY-YIG nuclease family protein [Patescibacteria group bacterium]